MTIDVAVLIRQHRDGRSPATWIRFSTRDITGYVIAVEVPRLDEARRPLHRIHSTSDVASTAPERCRTRVNIPTRLVIILQRIAVRTNSSIQSSELRHARIIAATRRSVVRDGILGVHADTFVEIDFARVGPVPVGTRQPECWPGTRAVGEMNRIKNQQTVMNGLFGGDSD